MAGLSAGSAHNRVSQSTHTFALRWRPFPMSNVRSCGVPRVTSSAERSTHIASRMALPLRRWQSVQWQA